MMRLALSVRCGVTGWSCFPCYVTQSMFSDVNGALERCVLKYISISITAGLWRYLLNEQTEPLECGEVI